MSILGWYTWVRHGMWDSVSVRLCRPSVGNHVSFGCVSAVSWSLDGRVLDESSGGRWCEKTSTSTTREHARGTVEFLTGRTPGGGDNDYCDRRGRHLDSTQTYVKGSGVSGRTGPGRESFRHGV